MQKEMQYPAVLQWRASAQKKTKIMAEKITPVYTPLLAVQIIANATSWELMYRSSEGFLPLIAQVALLVCLVSPPLVPTVVLSLRPTPIPHVLL